MLCNAHTAGRRSKKRLPLLHTQHVKSLNVIPVSRNCDFMQTKGDNYALITFSPCNMFLGKGRSVFLNISAVQNLHVTHDESNNPGFSHHSSKYCFLHGISGEGKPCKGYRWRVHM